MSDKYEKLGNLKKLLDDGVLTDAEFQAEKEKVLSEYDYNEESEYKPWGLDEDTYCVVLHLSQFAGYTVPLAGLILPIIMWTTEKQNSEKIDMHGRVVMNWVISSVIYAIVFLILAFFFIGIPLLIGLGICAIVFPIIGAIKAGGNICWHYPMAINFLSLKSTSDEY